MSQKVRIFNTLTRQKEEFKPIVEGKVLMYHCGPTVYWRQHIGNLRGMFVADTVARAFRYFGYEVRHVRNYTDVGHLTSDSDTGEDKMEKGAKREGLSPEEIAKKYIELFERDTKALNIVEPSAKPRATDYIPQMREFVRLLLDHGFAYVTPLAIYFDVSRAKDYTKLSHQKMDENVAGAGSGDVQDLEKRNPQDFAVWFFKTGAHKNALQTWPLGFNVPNIENTEGFPGWHLECSAMIKELLGNTIDIHLGGIEHISVHHTNEIAQSEAVNGGAPLANYWMHNEHLLVDGKKMSKSEGTSYSLDDLHAIFHLKPMALRFFFLQAGYRSKQNFTKEAIIASGVAYGKLVSEMTSLHTVKNGAILEAYKRKFDEALADDFNTASALAIVFETLRSGEKSEDIYRTILKFDEVLGLGLSIDTAFVKATEIPKNVLDLVAKRAEYKAHAQFVNADAVRAEIEGLGYEVKDTSTGPVVIKK